MYLSRIKFKTTFSLNYLLIIIIRCVDNISTKKEITNSSTMFTIPPRKVCTNAMQKDISAQDRGEWVYDNGTSEIQAQYLVGNLNRPLF